MSFFVLLLESVGRKAVDFKKGRRLFPVFVFCVQCLCSASCVMLGANVMRSEKCLEIVYTLFTRWRLFQRVMRKCSVMRDIETGGKTNQQVAYCDKTVLGAKGMLGANQ